MHFFVLIVKAVLAKEVLPENYNDGKKVCQPSFSVALLCKGLVQVYAWSLSPFSSTAVCQKVLVVYKYI